MEELGRIAAQTAKQILFQKVRDAVRSNVYEQYVDKIGDLVNGYVKRFERATSLWTWEIWKPSCPVHSNLAASNGTRASALGLLSTMFRKNPKDLR